MTLGVSGCNPHSLAVMYTNVERVKCNENLTTNKHNNYNMIFPNFMLQGSNLPSCFFQYKVIKFLSYTLKLFVYFKNGLKPGRLLWNEGV